jgi:hypothetical protein
MPRDDRFCRMMLTSPANYPTIHLCNKEKKCNLNAASTAAKAKKAAGQP